MGRALWGAGMGQAVLLLGLMAAAPPPPPRPTPEPDPAFADEVWPAVAVLTTTNPQRRHVRQPKAGELVAAAVAGLYAAANRPVPLGLTDRATGTQSEPALKSLLARTRAEVGNPPALAGRRAFLVAVDALARAADPYTVLSCRQSNRPGGSDLEFGLGFELDGLQPNGLDWLAFELSVGPKNEWPTPPLPLPWRVCRVLPGSPAGEAGMKPGDTLTAFDGVPLTPDTVGKAMGRLLQCRTQADETPQSDAKPLRLTVTRPGTAAPLTFPLTPRTYTPDTVFGYRRQADGRWDYFPDRRSRVAYLRLGYIEFGSNEAFAAAVAEIMEDRPAGLVLDLRWCAGGYVDPCKRIAASLLKPGRPLFLERKPGGPGTPVSIELFDRDGPETWAKLPLAVLVSPETAGGGELIAAAMQDHARGIVVGQRTLGRASTSQLERVGDSGFSLRVTTGYSDRITGKNRHRLPHHGAADDWGVRPNPGCGVPVTPDFSRRLREWADRQALRTGEERAAGPLDDPLDDPQRAMAEKRLKERIAAGGL